ncbi:hypothetical protein J3A83DRAFT_4099670 [Scleroderma citrinum]
MTRPTTSNVNASTTEQNDKGKHEQTVIAQVSVPSSVAGASTTASNLSAPAPVPATTQAPGPGPSKPAPTSPQKRLRIRKLAPPRPFPTVPPGRSATSPRSTSLRPSPDDPTCICVTRKTTLAAYIRRCKSAFLDHGAREMRLSAMGAAIPHLALLVGSLSTPGVLPYGEGEVKVEVYTGSVEVVDEVLSDSDGGEGEDGQEGENVPKEEFRTRVKSTMNVIVRIGDANPDPAKIKTTGKKKKGKKAAHNAEDEAKERQGSSSTSQQIVIPEPEQDDMDES